MRHSLARILFDTSRAHKMLLLVSTAFLLSACSYATSLGGGFEILNLLLQRKDFPGWSYEVMSGKGEGCGSRSVRSQPSPPVTTVIHEIIECSDEKTAKERFRIELKTFGAAAVYEDIGSGKKTY